MENFMILTGEDLSQFEHMIPEWILQMDSVWNEMTFWGMTDWKEPCGVAVTFMEDAMPTLLHIYVAPDYRKAGRAGRLLQEILFRSYQRGADSFRIKYIPDKYPELHRILRMFQGERTEEFIGTASGTIEELQRLKYLQGSSGSVKALSECTQQGLYSLYAKIVELGEALVELPPKKGDYVDECSAVILENGEPAGLLLVKKEGPEVKVPYMINLSSNIAAPIEMIRFALQKGSKIFSPQTRCSFSIINESLFQLLDKIGIKVQKREIFTIGLESYREYERNASAVIELARDMKEIRG